MKHYLRNNAKVDKLLNKMGRKKVFWLTGSSFFDVDEHIVPQLSHHYDIYWFVIVQKNSFYTISYIKKVLRANDIKGEAVDWPRLRSIKSFIHYIKLVLKIKSSQSNLVYINFLGLPYLFYILYFLRIDRRKLIYACHDFIDHVEIANRSFIQSYKRFVFSKFYNFQLFSKTQLNLFNSKYKKATFHAPLALKEFGSPTTLRSEDNRTHFLFFGKIQDRKGLEYLIEAANSLYTKFPNQFVIQIYGACETWSRYEEMILNKDCFDLSIRRIENDEIPNIFANADYLILPYKDVTQSGPLFISYYYNVPVIASDFPGFREYIDNGKTGFLFRSRDSQSLSKIMGMILEKKIDYDLMKSSLKSFVDKEMSLSEICKKYNQGFKMIIEENAIKYK